tara:strand:- start:482 stop:1702 length:1221 start_codon:yes stop_codon:yes gene_type:complete
MNIKETEFLSVPGLRQATCCSETKYIGRDDLLLIVLDKNSIISGCLTQSSAPSAPVLWCREKLKLIQNSTENIVLLVNAGNANAFTGNEGAFACYKKAGVLSKLFACSSSNILFASTGVIGEKLDVNPIISKLPLLKNSLSEKNFSAAASAILTTDTKIKGFSKKIIIEDKIVTLSGFAKGSGMIYPNMATMLAFIFTDYCLDHKTLSKFTKKAVDNSFNRISVDGDTSTSDSVFVGSTKKVDVGDHKTFDDRANKIFYQALEEGMIDLAKLIILDGEGATKFVEIIVKRAKTKALAKEIAFSIANSLLVKTAIAGEDANWGRIVMAIGKTQKKFDEEKLKIYFQNLLLTESGQARKEINEEKLKKELEKKHIEVVVDLDNGKQKFVAWTSDLTEKYVKINADYRS